MSILNTVLATENGKEFKAYVAQPDKPGKAPGLILMHEVYGVTDSIRKLAHRFAAQGFLVACPNMYWESAPDAHFVFESPEDVQKIKDGTIDPARKAVLDQDRNTARDLMFAFVNRAQQGYGDIGEKNDRIISYINKAATWLRAQDGCDGTVAATGFCFGGRNTYLALAKNAAIDAGVAFYATPQLSEVFSADEAAAISKPLLFVVGGEDPYINEKPLMVDASNVTIAYVAGLDKPFVNMNSGGNPNIGTLYYANSTHGFNRSESKYSDDGTSDHAIGLAGAFLRAALGRKEFRMPEEAFTTTPRSETYHPQHKV